jgi:hypothetical protein
MKFRPLAPAAIAGAVTLLLAGCGGSSDSCTDCVPPPVSGVTSYVGTTDTVAAWADPGSMTMDVAPAGVYAGKRQMIRGTVSPYTGAQLDQPAGVEIYEYGDGTVHLLDLTDIGLPSAVQVSSETAATIDPECTENGQDSNTTFVYSYTGVYFASNLASPADSVYVYRMPGPDGICNTTDDVLHAVHTGMLSTDAPLVAAEMPHATIYDQTGAIQGFIAKSGPNLVRLDANVSTPMTLATYGTADIQVLDAMPVGQVSGFETGRLFVVDGNIVHVDYASNAVSASLFAIPNWSPTDSHMVAPAASPGFLYFAINTPGVGGALGVGTIYQMPADGSAAPTVLGTVAGRVSELQFPVGGSSVLVGVVGDLYSIEAIPETGGLGTSVFFGTETVGRFTATSTDVYYTEWNQVTVGTTTTRTSPMSGIVAMDGTTVMATVPNSMFMIGGEAAPWPANDVTTQRTPLVTVFQVTGMSASSTTSSPVTGLSFTAPNLTGGTLASFDTSTNAMVATLGTFDSSTTATLLNGTVHPSIGHWLFLDAQTQASTSDPATHDEYLIESQTPASLVRASMGL